MLQICLQSLQVWIKYTSNILEYVYIILQTGFMQESCILQAGFKQYLIIQEASKQFNSKCFLILQLLILIQGFSIYIIIVGQNVAFN